jgi:hypothetical protein
MVRVVLRGLTYSITLDMTPTQTIAEMIVAADIRESILIHNKQEVYDFSQTIADVCSGADTCTFYHVFPLNAAGFPIGLLLRRNCVLRHLMTNAVIAGEDASAFVLEYQSNLILISELKKSYGNHTPVNTDFMTLEDPEEGCVK